MDKTLSENMSFLHQRNDIGIYYCGKRENTKNHIYGPEIRNHYLFVLVKKGRIGELIPVLAYFNECAMAYKKIGKVQIQTPMQLSEKQKKKIEQKLLEVSEYETLSVDYEIDKSLLGGIVISIGNQVLDNSIRAKLDAMTRDLSKVRLSN